jgi:DNA-binding PadR family transcriptional regulator
MENSQFNVQKLSKTLGLKDAQETILKLLMKADNYQIKEEFCRSKLKSIQPNFIINFQQKLRDLEKKNVIITGWEPDGTKMIKMTPIEVLSKMIDDSKEIESQAKVRSPIITKQVRDDIKNIIISLIETSLPNGAARIDIKKAIAAIYPSVSDAQLTAILTSLSSNNIIKAKRVGKKQGGYDKLKSFYILVKDKKEVSQAEQDNKTSIKIDLSLSDIEMLKTSLRLFSITDEPITWIKNRIEDTILRVSDHKMPLDGIILDEVRWQKFHWLKDNYHDKDNSDIVNTVAWMINDFIDNEHDKRFVYEKFNDIVLNTKSPEVLNNIKAMLDRRIKNLEHDDPKI